LFFIAASPLMSTDVPLTYPTRRVLTQTDVKSTAGDAADVARHANSMRSR
jgi:hypothetical protein